MAGVARAAETATLTPGAYNVDVHLEMSLGEDKPERHSVCLTDDRTTPAHGLWILTPDTPLSPCPISNVHETSEQITFDIICPGKNAGAAAASFDVTRDSFEGRISMLMGGKNMRMTEVQVGHRTGECKGGAPEGGR